MWIGFVFGVRLLFQVGDPTGGGGSCWTPTRSLKSSLIGVPSEFPPNACLADRLWCAGARGERHGADGRGQRRAAGQRGLRQEEGLPGARGVGSTGSYPVTPICADVLFRASRDWDPQIRDKEEDNGSGGGSTPVGGWDNTVLLPECLWGGHEIPFGNLHLCRIVVPGDLHSQMAVVEKAAPWKEDGIRGTRFRYNGVLPSGCLSGDEIREMPPLLPRL